MVNQPSLFDNLGEMEADVAEFFNTIHLSGPELAQAKEQTGLQDERVLSIFREHGKLTPFECWNIYCEKYPVCPVTSLRRSITVLTRRGKLMKLSEMKRERYGKSNHLWEAMPL